MNSTFDTTTNDETKYFGTSPSSVAFDLTTAFDAAVTDRKVQQHQHHGHGGARIVSSISLRDLVKELPRAIELNNNIRTKSGYKKGQSNDPIHTLMSRVELSTEELDTFAKFDLSRGYTRNLIDTDNQRYTLLMLCWTPGKYSPIHDHPCDGCWMKVIQGQIHEIRYRVNPFPSSSSSSNCGDSLICSQETICNEGEVLYMEDSMGLHKVGNPLETVPAISLHLYCPPFHKCNIWLNETYNKPCITTMSHFSEYGKQV